MNEKTIKRPPNDLEKDAQLFIRDSIRLANAQNPRNGLETAQDILTDANKARKIRDETFR